MNILKLHTNPKVLIQGFVLSFEILIASILALACSFYFDYVIISMSRSFKSQRHLFVKIHCLFIAELSALKVEEYPIHLLKIFTVIVPHPRWRQKPCNGLLY